MFDALGEEILEYNWLITDTDILARSESLAAISMKEYCFLSGESLTNIVRNDDAQWIWGVLSGFTKDISLEEILKYPLPYADGYPGFWKLPISMQHPLASMEIVPWDASLVLLFSKKAETADKFRTRFPKCEDLSQYIARLSGHQPS